MKKMALLLAAVFMMGLQMPVFAADATQQQKDECLLSSKECATQAESIQQKMKKLDAEIKKGDKVYSPDELKRLKTKLAEAEKLLDNLLRP